MGFDSDIGILNPFSVFTMFFFFFLVSVTSTLGIELLIFVRVYTRLIRITK